jgi:aminoglycoside 3-N-acetyltransferase
MKFQKDITLVELKQLFEEEFKIGKGDTLFIHSSIRNLKVQFSFEEIYFLLKELVGPEGTLLFPCWQIAGRAEEYLEGTPKPFNVTKTKSKMGFFSEFARMQKDSFRSLHPTNSIVSVGKNGKELLKDHHLDIYPCGEKSPFFKMMEYNAKIIGIGVDVVNLSFLHCVEDVMKEKFPIQTRLKQGYKCKVINYEGQEIEVETLVAHPNISSRDIVGFFNRNIISTICKRLTFKGVKFFYAKSNMLFKAVEELAKKGETIYLTK